MSIENTEFRPKIVAFCCNWCSYAGADLHSMLADIYPQYQTEPVQWTVPPDGRIYHCNP